MNPIGNDLDLGTVVNRNVPLRFPKSLRDKHLYVCGGTGTGKSKFLENLIRQDILNWHQSQCGVLVIDPHGSLYDSLMNWLSWHEPNCPIVPIDLRRDDWIISYNLLRKRQIADPAVVVDNFVDAMAYVWGQTGTDQTPLFARWANNVISALYEKELTLVEAALLTDHLAKDMRAALVRDLKNKVVRQQWEYINSQPAKEFDAQIGSTLNRLHRFTMNETMRLIFGQPERSLDLGEALKKGQIILVSLATERAKISKENAELFATLLLSDLWTSAQERGKHEGVKPFYVYIDECQRFVTPTMAENLDEARGYGLHVTMANQFPLQLLNRGEAGKRVYDSIMENASSKVVFRLTHKENLEPLAQWLYTGVLNPDEVKHELYSTKVMSMVEEYRSAYSKSTSEGRGIGKSVGRSGGEGFGTTGIFPDGQQFPASISESWHAYDAQSSSESEAWMRGFSESQSEFPVLIPQFGKELSHVQFRSLEEQLFRAMAVLFDQQERQSVCRLVGMHAPISLHTPTVTKTPASKERIDAYTRKLIRRQDFAFLRTEAQKRIEKRETKLTEQIFSGAANAEATTAKRRIVE